MRIVAIQAIDPGSTPAHRNLLIRRKKGGKFSVGGIAVRIVAFQAIDQGSTPGQRNLFISL